MDSQTIAELVTILTAKVDTLQEGVSAAIDSMGEYKQSSTDANEEVGKSFDAAAIAIAAAGYELDSYIREAADQAGQAQTNAIAIGALAEAFGKSADAAQGYVEQLTQMHLSTADAQQVVMLFLRNNLDLATSFQYVKAAQDLSAASGKTLTDTLNQMDQAVQRGQTRMLRQFGITETVTQLQTAYAISIGKTVDQLTPAEQHQATVNAFIEAASKFQGDYNKTIGSAAQVHQEYNKALEQFNESAGKEFLPLVTSIYSTMTLAINALIALPEPVKQGAAYLVLLAAGFTSVVGLTRILMFSLPAMIASLTVVINLYKSWAEILLINVARGILAAVSSMQLFSSGLLGMVGTLGIVGAAFLALELYMNHWEASLDVANAKLVEFNNSVQSAKNLTVQGIQLIKNPNEQLAAAQTLLKSVEDMQANAKGLTALAEKDLEVEKEKLQAIIGTATARAKDYQQSNALNSSELAGYNAEKTKFAFLYTAYDQIGVKIDDEKIKAEAAVDKDVQDTKTAAALKTQINQSYNLQKLLDDFKATDASQEDYDQYVKNLMADDAMRIKYGEALQIAYLNVIKTEQLASLTSMQSTAAQWASSFSTSFAQAFNVFDLQATNMGKVFEDIINKMVQDLLASGILDFLSLVFTGNPGTFGKGTGLAGNVFGFDDPVNDAMASKAGSSKWYNDFMRNFSQGYVSSALKTAPNIPTGGGGAGQTSIYPSVTFQTLIPPSAAQQRRAAMAVGNLIRKAGNGSNLA